MAKLPEYHPNVNARALDRVLASFSASYMSDTKWVKLLDALTSKPELVLECYVKLVWDDSPRRLHVENATFRHDYYPQAVEGMVSGQTSGWVLYREFEWLDFPSTATVLRNPNNLNAGTQQVIQNLDAIERLLLSIGQFQLTRLPHSLRLFAYNSEQRT